MLVGMDVTHPSPLSAKGSPSIASIVASCDDTFMNYPCSLRIQPRGELIKDVFDMFLERLNEYRRCNPKVPGGKPSKIIIYRDGVSEGEYGRVLGYEFPEIIRACEAFETGYRPRLTIIIVGKRHHTRFFPTEEAFVDSKTRNCLPGTVVDRGVTDVSLMCQRKI
ncbi:hypothetical protein ABW19_dt0201937 [Dactylella cylindrospora]|nr:hypothetical protein ABW19_dt0201937 [Dactylella cylindrospora]